MENFKEETMLLPEERIKLLEEENEKLRIAYEELLQQIEELSKNAFYDKLTGLKSRAFFEEEMQHLFHNSFKKNLSEKKRESDENDRNVCVVLFDIDKFKNVNDSFGHLVGDKVLKIVAQTIQDSVRDTDIAVRWGGEEIVLVLEEMNIQEATKKAEGIREKVSEIQFEKYSELKVTISAGVAASQKFKNFEALLDAADRALYKSKNNGRNKVTTFLY